MKERNTYSKNASFNFLSITIGIYRAPTILGHRAIKHLYIQGFVPTR